MDLFIWVGWIVIILLLVHRIASAHGKKEITKYSSLKKDAWDNRMNKLDEGLRILQVLVESAGGSIEPIRHLLRRNHTDLTARDDIVQLEALYDAAINGFFHCAARNVTFTDVSRIEKFFGRTLEENYPRVSPTFMKLARTYWTFRLAFFECLPDPDPSICIKLLQEVDINFAGVFFPSPGPFGQPKELREKTMRTLIEQSGADLDVEDYIRGNFYLR